jgi:cell division protein FtsQ
MKKKILIIIPVLAVLVIAACVLVLTGVIRLPQKKEEAPMQAVAYIEYMNSFMLIDKNLNVMNSLQEPPAALPKVTGLDFEQIIVGEKLEPINKEAAKYAMKLVDCIHKNSLDIAEVYVSLDLNATMYVGNIRILMGQDEATEEKMHDLRDFYDDVKGLSGVLDMQELSKDNLGYTFKTN